MDEASVFSVLSQCFAPVDEAAWRAVSAPVAWNEFLTGARHLLQEDDPQADRAPILRARASAPLQDFLADEEVRALFAPPTHAEKEGFAARHFIGGLAQSAMPVESLYVPWTQRPGAPFANQTGLYRADTALYMEDLLARMGLSIPEPLTAYPDHLAVELGAAAALFDAGRADDAWLFLRERTAWLTAYRAHLADAAPNDELTPFHLALVDLTLGICARQWLDDPCDNLRGSE